MKGLNVGFLVVGSEILQGFTTDTNSTFLSRHLTEQGHHVTSIMTVADDVANIVRDLKAMLRSDLDVVFVCGGLGSTPDDVTMEAVGKALGIPLVVNSKAKGWIAERVKALHDAGRLPSAEMDAPHVRMARAPVGSKVLHNKAGTAPGVVVDLPARTGRTKKVIVLPGVPKELKYLYTAEIEGKVLKTASQVYYYEEITVHIPESIMTGVLEKFTKELPQISIGSYPQDDMSVILRISGKKLDVVSAVKRLRHDLSHIEERDFI